MTYELGTHIDSEFMLVKNDRETDARDSMRNAEDDKHRQHIGRGALRGLADRGDADSSTTPPGRTPPPVDPTSYRRMIGRIIAHVPKSRT